MTDTLFSNLDVATSAHTRTGYRLRRVEVFNWGTFDTHVWTLRPDGQTTLLTGDIGSGKSTLVDAITTLLLPAHRISYNKAAGADVKERTLRSYVEGHYKSERNEVTGASRPVGLRDHRSYSVILGVFANEGFDETVTIAQVFHQKDRAGQPDRFFVTAASDLAVATDFADFGADLKSLRARLRQGGAEIDNTFPDYHRRVRRLLGIRSEQAMELFHQTVSMKSVGNLNDFVRGHMLEPVDAGDRVRAIVDHYEHLVKAHEAVRTATEQLALLTPLAAAADKYDAAAERHRTQTDERSAVVPYISERVQELLVTEIASRRDDVEALERRKSDLAAARDALVPARDRLVLERAGVGGDRLAALDSEIPRAAGRVEDRAERRRRYGDHLQNAGLAPVDTSDEFRDRDEQAADARSRLQAQRDALRARQDPLLERKADVRRAASLVATELDGLRSRRNSLPADLDDVRRRLCTALRTTEDEVPFAGELLDVRDEHAEWRGAAERVLRGFALSMLVPQQRYAEVSRWVNDNRLGARLVYLRVAERRVRTVPSGGADGPRLSDAIVVEPGPFSEFLAGELAQRADHRLAETVAQLQREDRAVTREGLVRDRDRHEKDDRRAASDPRGWVLGRGSEQKIAALEAEASDLAAQRADIEAALVRIDEESAALTGRASALAALAEYTALSEIDVEGARAELGALEQERQSLESGSSPLAEINRRLDALDEESARIGDDLESVVSDIGGAQRDLTGFEKRQRHEQDAVAAMGAEVIARAREFYPALEQRATRSAVRTVDDGDALRENLIAALTSAIEGAQREMNGYTTSIQQQMSEILRRWPHLRSEMDASVHSIGDFRTMHARVERDDLPQFEKEFRHQLNTNAVRELAQFHNWLRRQAEEIHARVDLINEALGAIDYNPGRIIVLVPENTVNQDIRQFRGDLREATSDVLTPGDTDAEARFEQVRELIERFKGRPNHADSDRAWLRRVTDVRNWYTFAASEQDRRTGQEYEHYTDSDGKSGGQKEKLAYTILAASLAYQFGLEWGVERSRDFRFAVIDEAFGRGSDASTRYALELFEKLGLQLLIVTPLQKVHVIEPYVSAIGFVDNPTGAASRVHTLTIEEFREQQAAARR
ncbi:AAA family ATPase [Microbacterium sp. LRZ72]|uniref:ATP-binding protein n=1 Tax=Microbacterium sp. LRZ72 TaxID=2942481 RepID=UPI0029B2A8E6|nr:ATP-binding protein [Microbacterium sp. LRZ72]MDX2375215.1 AAA family ATPase [Microbacterium sp. LRZ72]